jgi:hypothetical protein
MAACAHGAGYSSCPPAKVSHDFNQADQGSALLSHAMQHHHAAGGPISPLASIAGSSPQTMRYTLPHLGNPMGTTGHMRAPHVPLAGTLHNIDQHMGGARMRLPALRAGGRYDTGGSTAPNTPPVQPAISPEMRAALQKAWFTQRAPTLNGQRVPDLNRPQGFDDGGPVNSSSPGSPGVGGAVRDALAALKDYMIDAPRRQIQADRQQKEDAIMQGTYTGPSTQGGAHVGDYAKGGGVPGEQAKTAIRNALAHLANKDASSAAATLRASPAAMKFLAVQLAAHALRAGKGVAPATQGLTQAANAAPVQAPGSMPQS